MKHIINTSSCKAIQFGKFCSKWFFEIRNNTGEWAVEIKGFGYHFRWYPGRKFHFLRPIA